MPNTSHSQFNMKINFTPAIAPPPHPDNIIIKFADDTKMLGLISGGEEAAYRAEVEEVSIWYKNQQRHPEYPQVEGTHCGPQEV